jgi:N-acetylglucosamine kinase
MVNRNILAFDIGGSRIRAARGGQMLGEVATPLQDFAAFAAALKGFVRADDLGVAMSIAGVVHPDSGRATVANIPCVDGRVLRRDRAVRARILRKVQQPLVVVAETGADAGLIGAAVAGEAAFG